ncbi:f-box domain-containing protein [Ophiostoma piceae UAMH 11346]|uniref:F-box domain-containing protein n=1 Tax=Ophiostoma piceae (strain UAMH 11346) TaxID=1262450 RepID=S3C089_OPHP1|nr:f-box domain-containing protein [Ophiostoma piceae UAMH 11346]
MRALLHPGSPVSSVLYVDYLSSLSDELLIRILAYLSLPSFLSLAPVSRRFHRLSDDSQLWKAIYYDRFVLPRAMRIPGFRGGTLTSTPRTKDSVLPDTTGKDELPSPTTANLRRNRVLSWKQQYKLRHNWARGKCAVEELRLGGAWDSKDRLDLLNYCSQDGDDDNGSQSHRMIVKVVEGIAVTADRTRGLRVWELKSRSLVAGELLCREPKPGHDTTGMEETHKAPQINETTATSNDYKDFSLTPTSLAVDVTANGLGIAVGLFDGGFDIWQFDFLHKTLTKRFAHPASSNGSLTGISYSHPYVLTATDSVLVSLYVFGAGRKSAPRAEPGASSRPSSRLTSLLHPPHLLTSLRSHTSRPPLALSIRKLATVIVASIAYTFPTRQGWSIGIQDLHVKMTSTGGSASPTIISTQLAYSPFETSSKKRNGNANSGSYTSSFRGPREAQGPPALGSLRSRMYTQELPPEASFSRESSNTMPNHCHTEDDGEINGPTSLCYSHPYLLATMPDNTLILHLCTSNASSLVISPGIRLWGHTSGISDADITARGKAVSVSIRGEEMRVWELEGSPAAERGLSVAIRPNAIESRSVRSSSREEGSRNRGPDYDWDERRNWVGFDDEMVIVLKESRGGQESLMVYDFT